MKQTTVGDVVNELRREIEILRQQLTASQSENESLRKANLECIEYFNESQKDLAAM